jgi:hypothetical protein
MRIRLAQPSDVEEIHRLIYELAVYEKAPEEMVATIDQINASLFNESPVAFCHVAEVDGNIVGIALWFLNYSTCWVKPVFILKISLFSRNIVATVLAKVLCKPWLPFV